MLMTKLLIIFFLAQADIHADNFELGNIDRWLPDFDTCRDNGYLPGCRAKLTNNNKWVFETPVENCVYMLANGVARCFPSEFIEALNKSKEGLWITVSITNNFGGPAAQCLYICNNQIHNCSISKLVHIPTKCLLAFRIGIFLDNLETGDTRKWSKVIE